jgi:uncharacterized YccA/Bax inhibitor family protein
MSIGIGLSLLVVAAGAVLTWGVTADVAHVNVDTVGIILLVVGIAGLILSLAFTFSREGWARHGEPPA